MSKSPKNKAKSKADILGDEEIRITSCHQGVPGMLSDIAEHLKADSISKVRTYIECQLTPALRQTFQSSVEGLYEGLTGIFVVLSTIKKAGPSEQVELRKCFGIKKKKTNVASALLKQHYPVPDDGPLRKPAQNTISRYAAALNGALEADIDPGELVPAFKLRGGIEAFAEAHRSSRRDAAAGDDDAIANAGKRTKKPKVGQKTKEQLAAMAQTLAAKRAQPRGQSLQDESGGDDELFRVEAADEKTQIRLGNPGRYYGFVEVIDGSEEPPRLKMRLLRVDRKDTRSNEKLMDLISASLAIR